MTPLTLANLGEINYIRKITGEDEVRGRLADLGIVVDTPVKVISVIGGNVIVAVKDSRIALDKEVAERIMI